MLVRTFVSRLLFALAVLGIVTAPVARPAMAMTMNPPGMDHAMTGVVSPAMAADMPCCPEAMHHADAGKTADVDHDGGKFGCGKDCPLMSACMTSMLGDAVEAPGLSVPMFTTRIVYPQITRHIAGFAGPPALRPPTA